MAEQQYEYGMIGLGTMGRNLVYNICDHGFSVAGLDTDKAKADALVKEGSAYKLFSTTDAQAFVSALKQPRVIMFLVPAGAAVDSVINELKPMLSPEDLLMDCGNSHFTDTDRRTDALAKENLHFMGVGVSGGESGARFGPSIMPGGALVAYKRVASMLEAVSAKVNGDPCVAYLGPRSAGHYVKMVHNGIEYGIMQLISEAYNILKTSGRMSNNELQQTFAKWNEGILQSFLIEITADIFGQADDLTGNSLVDMILDSARQKGTGQWTSQNAMDLQTPIPTIDIAVTTRDLSAFKEQRVQAGKILQAPAHTLDSNKAALVQALEQALYFAMITAYAQGMSLLQKASSVYKYDLKIDEVAKIWRGGCIIRAALLEDIRAVYAAQPDLSNLLLSEVFAQKLNGAQEGMRSTVVTAVKQGIPAPALMASLAYFDGYRSGWMPANLIQAQRDYFGAHTYERTDSKGFFHTQWNHK